MLIGSETYPIMISSLVFLILVSISSPSVLFTKRLDAPQNLANKNIFAEFILKNKTLITKQFYFQQTYEGMTKNANLS